MEKFLDSNTISQVDVVTTLRSYIEENDTMFSGIWVEHLCDFVSELTGISRDTLDEYVNAE